MKLADKYRIYLYENEIQPRPQRFAIADAMDYLKEATMLQIRKEAGRLLGKAMVSEPCVSSNLEKLVAAGLVEVERPDGEMNDKGNRRGRPFIYKVKEG